MRLSSRRFLLPFFCLLFLILACAAAYSARESILSSMGHFLVLADAPVPADIVIVLAGDFSGNRILKGGDLVRQGLAGIALVSGPPGLYGHNEADLAVDFAVTQGYPPAYFRKAPHQGLSTQEEAEAVALELRRLHVRKALLVTSDYHTRRAGNIFRSTIPAVQFRVIAAPSPDFRAGSWWRFRQGRKTFFFEATKSVAGPLGL